MLMISVVIQYFEYSFSVSGREGANDKNTEKFVDIIIIQAI